MISNAKLDYERLASPNISVAIQATDDGQPTLSCIKNLSIMVNEINEGANEINLSPDHVVLLETAPRDTNISELVCNNPEKWQAVEYSIISNHSIFKIVKIPYNATYDPPILNKAGVKQRNFELFRSFLFLNETLPSYDTNPSYDILLRVTDDGEPQKTFVGNVFVNISRVDPCLPVNNCSANANCTRSDGFIYKCTCFDGYEGNGYKCTEIDDCAKSTKYCELNETTVNDESCSPCKNNATCIDKHLSFHCICLPGYDGAQCFHNINECHQSNFNYSCNKEHSKCIDGVNNITCDCDRGFEDWLCNTNIDDCADRPCGAFGKCHDYIGRYLASIVTYRNVSKRILNFKI